MSFQLLEKIQSKLVILILQLQVGSVKPVEYCKLNQCKVHYFIAICYNLYLICHLPKFAIILFNLYYLLEHTEN